MTDFFKKQAKKLYKNSKANNLKDRELFETIFHKKSCTLMNAQHIVAQQSGVRMWKDLISLESKDLCHAIKFYKGNCINIDILPEIYKKSFKKQLLKLMATFLSDIVQQFCDIDLYHDESVVADAEVFLENIEGVQIWDIEIVDIDECSKEMSLTLNAQVKYSYRIEGHDASEWHYDSEDKEIFYFSEDDISDVVQDTTKISCKYIIGLDSDEYYIKNVISFEPDNINVYQKNSD